MTGPWPFRIPVLLLIGALLIGASSALLYPGATVHAKPASNTMRLPSTSLADGSVNCWDFPGAAAEIYAPGDVAEIGPTSRGASPLANTRFVAGFAPDAHRPRPFTGLVEITGSPMRVAGSRVGLGCFWPVRVLYTGEGGYVELIEGQAARRAPASGSIPRRFLPIRP